MKYFQAFTVDVVNMTYCSTSEEESGDLIWDLSSEESADQLFYASFEIPVELNEDAYVVRKCAELWT